MRQAARMHDLSKLKNDPPSNGENSRPLWEFVSFTNWQAAILRAIDCIRSQKQTKVL